MSKELVVDRVAEYLVSELGVPEDMIEIETPLSTYEDGVEGVIDISVVVEDEDGSYVPVLAVQCLDDDIELTDEVVNAQIDFLSLIDETTNVGRIILTNGDQMMYASWEGQNVGEELPTYDELVKEYKDMIEDYNEFIKNHPDHDHVHDDNCDHKH